jgi:hypothetical protein
MRYWHVVYKTREGAEKSSANHSSKRDAITCAEMEGAIHWDVYPSEKRLIPQPRSKPRIEQDATEVPAPRSEPAARRTAPLKPGGVVSYRHPRYGALSGVILDRAPGQGHWWIHTEMRDTFDNICIVVRGKRKGMTEYHGRFTAGGKRLD